MKKIILAIFSCFFLFNYGYAARPHISLLETSYLMKPTGRYGIGFKDYHWINHQICPDFNFNGKNQDDFSAENTKHCHEIMARVYYPIDEKPSLGSNYYEPEIRAVQDGLLKQYPNIPVDQVNQLSELQSYAVSQKEISQDKTFPMILFSPGFGLPAQVYENFITELVSHGYVVIGINSPFINLVELPNKHVVEPAYVDSNTIKQFVQLQRSDLLYVYQQVYTNQSIDSIFSKIDLSHVGAFGHSIGGLTISSVGHDAQNWLSAGLTFDIGMDSSGASRKSFNIPFMHQIASTRKDVESPAPIFELGDNNYLVGIAPSDNDRHYSTHTSFTDLSTIQSTPVFKTIKEYLNLRIANGFDLKFLSHKPTQSEIEQYQNITYVLYIENDVWRLALYENKQYVKNITIGWVPTLEECLNNLPHKKPEDLSENDINPVKEIMISLHKTLNQLLGEGDGWEITESINENLLQFFDTFLKNNENTNFQTCQPLKTNTYFKCGPGIVDLGAYQP
ncbi:hypothetical protein [Legionella santicrucis]|nr:hypothetical protein [Legionella santicrucis]